MLTKKEKQILEAIIACIDRNEFVPTVREIARDIGLSSISATHRCLESLEEKGFIERTKSKPRAMRVLEKNANVS